MPRMRRSRPGDGARRLLAAAVMLAAAGALGVALAQSGLPGAFSLNSPVTFPVDI